MRTEIWINGASDRMNKSRIKSAYRMKEKGFNEYDVDFCL